MKKLLIFSLLTMLLSACATLPEEQCANPDWERIGRIDGERGADYDNYRNLANTCKRIDNAADEALYKKGWDAGQAKFCTAENGYKSGAYGILETYGCSAQQYPAFNEQFRLGRQVRSLKSEKGDLEKEKTKRQEDQGFFNQLGRTADLLSGRDPDESINKQQAELNQKIRFLENNAEAKISPTSELSYHLNGHQHSLADYGGAWIGTFMGFGIGHAIQGRYAESGWKWTAGEISAVALMVATQENCRTEMDNFTGKMVDRCDTNPWAIAAFLGVHIWQAYDLWHYANTRNNIYAMPTGNGLIIGYQF
jgi:hypothetical protein